LTSSAGLKWRIAFGGIIRDIRRFVLRKSVSRGPSGLARAIEHLLFMKKTPIFGFGSGRTTNTNKCSPNNRGRSASIKHDSQLARHFADGISL
jgi:hypothetical protein